MANKMIMQNKHEYALSVSHLTEDELLQESTELQKALDDGAATLTDEQVAGLKEGIQAIFEAVLRREALTEMTMDELNQCIVDNEAAQEQEARVWEAEARAEFIRRMTRLVHAAFTEESSESADASSEEDA